MAVIFLLASPVVNPIVFASTAAAFGFGKILYWRLGLSVLIAALTALVFARHKHPAALLRQPAPTPVSLGAAYPAVGQEDKGSKPFRYKMRRVADRIGSAGESTRDTGVDDRHLGILFAG